jgi:hypothetical protein
VTSGLVPAQGVPRAESAHERAGPRADGPGEIPVGATGAARTDPPLSGAVMPAAPVLPRRNPSATLAAAPGRQVRPRPGPELLRRVLDGLNRL